MAIVNFSIPTTLNLRVAEVMKKQGFASKAEFFRFAAINLINLSNQKTASEDDRFDFLSQSLSQAIINRYQDKKIPSLKDQLADI